MKACAPPPSDRLWRHPLFYGGGTTAGAGNKDSFTQSVDVPGVSASDVKVSVDNGMLNISGERRKEAKSGDATWNRVERSYGAFERRFRLPPAAKEDHVAAKLDSGVLHATIPKDEAKAPSKQEGGGGAAGHRGPRRGAVRHRRVVNDAPAEAKGGSETA